MKVFPRLLLLLLVAVVTNADDSNKTMTAKQFLERCRRPPNRESWANMEGEVRHQNRKLRKMQQAKIYVAIQFKPTQTDAQIVIDNQESYRITQFYKTGKDSTLLKMEPEKLKNGQSKLSQLGLRAEDLTLTFLYWDLKMELGEMSSKGIDCRVLLLENPEKTEMVRVAISKDSFFPIKVEWFKRPEGDGKTDGKNILDNLKPFRSLEMDSFKKEDNYYFVRVVDIYGPPKTWKTRVKFEKTDAGSSEKPVPKNLFRNIGSAKDKAKEGASNPK